MARLPKSIIKKYGISKKAWRVFRGRKRSTKRRSPTKRSVKKIARRRRYYPRRRRRSSGFNVSKLFKWIRIGAAAAPAVASVAERGLTMEAAKAAFHRYSGYNIDSGQWEPHMLLQGWGPYLGAVVATYGIQKVSSILRRL